MKPGSKGIVAIVLVLMLALIFLEAGMPHEPRQIGSSLSFNVALWEYRGFDILGQVMLLIAGSFGVVVLLREGSPHD
jgi:multisubunit Na+/H+ antiporter MnhB subunit